MVARWSQSSAGQRVFSNVASSSHVTKTAVFPEAYAFEAKIFVIQARRKESLSGRSTSPQGREQPGFVVPPSSFGPTIANAGSVFVASACASGPFCTVPSGTSQRAQLRRMPA